MTSLTYRHASKSWLDRLPLGNGRLGAMVGVEPTRVRIGLNEATAWSGGVGSAAQGLVDPLDASAALSRGRALIDADDPVGAEEALRPLQHGYSQAFLPVGEVEVQLPTAGAAVTRTLDLTTGVHTAALTVDGGTWEMTTATCLEDDVLVHTVRSSTPGEVRISLSTPLKVVSTEVAADALTLVAALPADVAPSHEPDSPALTWDLPGIEPLHAVVRLRVTTDGEPAADGEALLIRGATSTHVAVALETTFTSATRPPEALQDAIGRAVMRATAVPDEALRRHVLAHAERARRFTVRLGPDRAFDGAAATGRDPAERLRAGAAGGDVPATDPALVALLLEYCRYLLLSSSRDGCLPANLQGIWNAELQPPWSSAYTLNINLPMNYWGAESTGASGSHRALLPLLEALAERGQDTARRLYGARGWVAHHNSDAWAYTLPTNGDASWSQWAMGGAWLVRQFDEQRRFGGMDEDTLRRFWPVARGASRFLLDFLRLDADGVPFTSPSTSPENRYLHQGRPASLTRSSAMDRALVRDVLLLTAEIAATCDPEDPIAHEARKMATRIPGPRVSADGTVAEWGEPREQEDVQHRHLSHLFGWYPGAAEPGPVDAAAAATLDARGDDSTGWSLAWKIALRARLGDGAAVGRLLNLVLRPADDGAGIAHRGGLYPNLFAAHPPFQIDGNLGFLGAFVESLLQSHRPGRIEVLPALAPGLDDGAVTGLVARPGIHVDLAWRHRRPTRVTLAARSPQHAGRYLLAHCGEELDVEVPAQGRVHVDFDPAH
ncbi:glycoside hydrolase N-terminal domain-containing protein [Tessaracoccus sp. MC1627]|uniref:glycosyl hydrolase family 95 catalytic domain-containing protein n=1 Tax=Tessaracoccus sp. MC1627 TaxID=2760312 RepID=UPI001603FC4D|nr:glycoside hydrolase N-terminal domain-containing protein [Tessaracoccus sp. MC1627]MBB1512845.1 glycoside hydrolase N-terminal domain-containing protein [Tessaracoccus sp. MC1627]